MNRLYALIMLVCVGCGSDPVATPVAPRTVDDRPVLVCLGDSLTAGYGVDDAAAWPALLEAELADADPAYRIVNAGVSGDTSTGGLQRLDWVLKADPALVIVALGGNDGLRGIDPDLTRANLAAIIERLQQEQVEVVLAGMQIPTNFGPEHTAAFKHMYPELALQFGVRLIPFLLEGVAMQPELNLVDGIHPNEAGHRLIASQVAAVLSAAAVAP